MVALAYGPSRSVAQPPDTEEGEGESSASEESDGEEGAIGDEEVDPDGAGESGAEGGGEGEGADPDAADPDAADPDAADPDAADPDAADPDAADPEPAGPVYEPSSQLRQPRTICHGRRIRRIDITGGGRVAEDDIRATMELRAGVPCTDPEVTRDARALWDLGFFDDIVFGAEAVGENEIILSLAVRERPAIGRVSFIDNDEVSDSDLDDKVTLREGEVLSVPDVQRQISRIRDLYAEEGYFLAQVRYELREMPNNEVEVRFLISEGEEVTVRRVRFVGNDNLPASDITAFMRTSETGFFSFISSNDTFNREFFEEDVQRIQVLYYDRGYLAVRVGTPRIELTPDRRFIDVTIPIEEGPRFRIGRLRVAELDDDGEEIEPLGGRRTVREMVQTNPGEWFSRSEIAESLLAVTRHYRDEGFALVEVVPNTDLDMNERRVNVVVAIRRGPPVRIERINISGNSKTRDQVIRRELAVAEGQLYSMTDVEISKARVTRLGYFERVDVSEEEGSAPDRIVLNFEIAERATGTFQVGAGFSSLESFIFTAQVQQQNFLGRGQAFSLQLQLSGIRQLIQLRFAEPWLFGTQWSFSADVFRTIRSFSTFVRDSTGGAIAFGHPIFDDRLRLTARYRGEIVDIDARTGGIFSSGQGQAFDSLRTLTVSNLFRDGFLSSLQFSLTWDSRDNRLFPTGGVFANYSLEIADRFVGSENVFIRHRAFARFYWLLFDFFTLKLNTEAGLITSRQPAGVPVFERFFLGGIFNLRGFRINSIGPRGGLSRQFDPNATPLRFGENLGGNLQFFYNLELEFPILKEVGVRGVLFLDGGNAWNLEETYSRNAPLVTNFDPASDPDSLNLLRIRTSWGFGIRWISPLGPLRFEWGLPFNPRANEDSIRFEFTIGNSF
ncbi:MAG: outer membrane protein assembly factor BamA [Myxococcota bacterium]